MSEGVFKDWMHAKLAYSSCVCIYCCLVDISGAALALFMIFNIFDDLFILIAGVHCNPYFLLHTVALLYTI